MKIPGWDSGSVYGIEARAVVSRGARHLRIRTAVMDSEHCRHPTSCELGLRLASGRLSPPHFHSGRIFLWKPTPPLEVGAFLRSSSYQTLAAFSFSRTDHGDYSQECIKSRVLEIICFPARFPGAGKPNLHSTRRSQQLLKFFSTVLEIVLDIFPHIV